MQDPGLKRHRRRRWHRKSRRKIKLALMIVGVWIIAAGGLIYVMDKPASESAPSEGE